MEEENKTPEQENVNQPQQQTETAKPTNWWKVIAIILIIAIVIFSVVKLAECAATNNQNSDGTTHLTRRSAKNSDISFDTDTDWSSLGTKIIITPKVDIDDLKITVNIKNSNKITIYTTEKYIGDVKKSVQANCSVTLSELGWSNSLNAEYVAVSVTGGTVSYFT